jgi:hypothetical protein
MIYDEGFEVRVGPARILVFNEYFKGEKNSKEWKSNCAKTIVGWFHNEETNEYACVKGKKKNGKDIIRS